MTKNEAMELNTSLIMISSLGNTKLKYAILKNIEVLKPTITPLVTIENDMKKLVSEFEKERNNLIIKLGSKSSGDKVFIDMEDKEQVEKFQEGLELLSVTYKKDIDSYNQQYAEFIDLKKEQVEEILILHPIQLDLLPSDGISFEVLSILQKHNLIKE